MECSDEATLVVQRTFQNCSHEISTRVYETSLGLTRPAAITSSLCKALTDIATDCVDHLRKCDSSYFSS